MAKCRTCGRDSACGVGCPSFPYDDYKREQREEENNRLLKEIARALREQNTIKKETIDK